MYFRIRVTLDVEKPIKRRMNIKREGGEWNWVNFKYEPLSLFCFVCEILGHSERDCSVVYAHPNKVVEKAYGTWLRAPMKGGKQQNLEAQGHSGDLALLWKNENGCTVLDGSKHYIDFEVENSSVGRWRYTGFYGCPDGERRRKSWDILKELATRSTLPWCVIGDFNDMLYADKKRGGRIHPRNLLVGFGDTITAGGLSDLGFKELFKAQVVDGRLSDRERVNMVSSRDNENLLEEITPEEVKEAAFSMHPDKPP
ncbi:hypothetical protein AgCh_023859 [Apium graveolens]